MPILHRFGSVSIRMYADDHRPAHFHIVGADFQVLVSIAHLRVIEGRVRNAQISEALDWAKLHQDMLALKWVELNERD